jgi:tripartite-type tricarboxylate transporter receptor subunit TctC
MKLPRMKHRGPGTPPDQIRRAIAPRLSESFSQPVVVENRVE